MGGLFSLPLELKHEIPSWADPFFLLEVSARKSTYGSLIAPKLSKTKGAVCPGRNFVFLHLAFLFTPSSSLHLILAKKYGS